MEKENPEHNYQCRNCGLVKKGSIIPSSFKCKVNALHSWYDLGPAGVHQYRCTKCDTVVDSKSTPLMDNCPEGNTHKWHLR